MEMIDFVNLALVVSAVLLSAVFTSHCEFEHTRKQRDAALRRVAKRVHASDFDLARRVW